MSALTSSVVQPSSVLKSPIIPLTRTQDSKSSLPYKTSDVLWNMESITIKSI
ncbi:Uncharacterised protein [Cronobacter sakazakii]|nr:Uncharacterised protein [Cronobacter sakazakii]